METYCTLILEVAKADVAAFASLMDQMALRGIRFSSLAQEQAQQTDWLSLFCDLDNETRRGHIGAPRSIDQMPERMAFLGIEPEMLFLAVLEQQYIGYTLLNRDEANPRYLNQGWTGVRPEYQRQGIGTALKIVGIAYAQKQGYERITTKPRIANVPSVGMSIKVGFQLDADNPR